VSERVENDIDIIEDQEDAHLALAMAKEATTELGTGMANS
jgi:hypothetical protein